MAIEEPFTILPLEKICDTIEGNVRSPPRPACCQRVHARLAAAPARAWAWRHREASTHRPHLPTSSSPIPPPLADTQVRELHKLHSARGLEAQRAAGVALLDAEMLVEEMCGPQPGVAYANSPAEAAVVVANGALPAQQLLEAAAQLRAAASSTLASTKAK